MNDIAILKLNEVVVTANSPNINTVCLPNAAPVPGTRYSNIGYYDIYASLFDFDCRAFICALCISNIL